MESHNAVSRIQGELERNDSEALRNVAICRAVQLSRVVEVRRSLPETIDAKVGFGDDIAVVDPLQS